LLLDFLNRFLVGDGEKANHQEKYFAEKFHVESPNTH
jgi:hypothetical protein